MHGKLLHNDEIRSTAENLVSPGQVGLLNGWGVFSTLRVSHGALFAFPRHFRRMKKDAALMRVPFPSDPAWLEERLLRLVEANQAYEATLRVAIIRNKGGMFDGPGIERDFDVVAFTKDLSPWGAGLRLSVAAHARYGANRYSGAKILSWSQNLNWLEEAREKGFDEVILLNEHNQVSECTSANIFVVQGTRVWTPPLSSGCLPGITREILLEEIRVRGISIGEKALKLSDLEAGEEVFVTSTTRDLLPVLEVDGLRIQQNTQIRDQLQEAFTQYVIKLRG
jgi:branched-chain amino acid aminotransferase